MLIRLKLVHAEFIYYQMQFIVARTNPADPEHKTARQLVDKFREKLSPE